MKPLLRIDSQPVWDQLCPEWKIVPAPPPRDRIEICVAGNPVLKCGETVELQIRFLSDGKPVAGKKLNCVLRRDFHEDKRWEAVSGTEPILVQTTLDRPGFVRLGVEGEGIAAALGAGFEPGAIEAAPEVAGFCRFWEEQKRRLAAVPVLETHCDEVPLDDPQYTGVRCFDVGVACAGSAPVSGILALPDGAKAGSLPGYLFVHGAGVRPAFQSLPWAAHGMLAFNVNALGLPNRAGADFYRHATEVTFKDYPVQFYDNPEDSLFVDMVLRVLRALEYLKSRPEWDGRTLIVHGGSQGGFQALAAAGLDADVSFVVACAPAMCNLAGSLEGRTDSWPHTVRSGIAPEYIRSACFCDGASFARHAKAEAVFTVGFSDTESVPSSVYAAYHVYGGPKRLLEFPDRGHETSVFWTGEAEILDHIENQKKES